MSDSENDEYNDDDDLDNDDELEASLEPEVPKKDGRKVHEPGMESDESSDEDDEVDADKSDDEAELAAFREKFEETSLSDATPSIVKLAADMNELVLDADHKKVCPVPDDERITSDVLQHTEMVACINYRIAQIEAGAPYFVDATGKDTGKELTTAAEIAKAELLSRKCPLILRRDLFETRDNRIITELWNINEMAFDPTLLK